MNRTMIIALAAFLVTAFVGATVVDAAIMTSGGANPVTDEFSSNAGATGTSEAGPPANWRMISTTGSGFYRTVGTGPGYSGSPDNELEEILEGENGWTATLQVKVNAAVRDRTVYMYVQDGLDMFDVIMYDGSDFSYENPGAFYRQASGHSVDNPPEIGDTDPTVWNTYKIVLDGKGNTNPADDEITLWANGVVDGPALSRSDFPDTIDRAEFGFGRMAGAGSADAHYGLVSLEANPAPIPEPSALLLLGLGLTGLIGCRRRK